LHTIIYAFHFYMFFLWSTHYLHTAILSLSIFVFVFFVFLCKCVWFFGLSVYIVLLFIYFCFSFHHLFLHAINHQTVCGRRRGGKKVVLHMLCMVRNLLIYRANGVHTFLVYGLSSISHSRRISLTVYMYLHNHHVMIYTFFFRITHTRCVMCPMLKSICIYPIHDLCVIHILQSVLLFIITTELYTCITKSYTEKCCHMLNFAIHTYCATHGRHTRTHTHTHLLFEHAHTQYIYCLIWFEFQYKYVYFNLNFLFFLFFHLI
jgi:hypothetical protein